jgi:site-specific DNA recombinase
MKPNEGEVPQYYVENSHPAIIEPDEWNHVQYEFARRKALGRTYSGKSSLAAKLVCEDCGGFFGSKVWHSTDKYRRTIWQCNSKFSNEEHCGTPTLDTETVQQMFITAYNQLMQNRSEIVSDCESMRKLLTDFTSLDAEIDRQMEETQVVAELVKAAVKENASTAQSQEAYLKKYESLTARYETAAKELERLQAERTRLGQQDKAMGLFIRTLKRQPERMDTWDDTIWMVMVEKAIVHRDGSITFIFYNGTEIKVGA